MPKVPCPCPSSGDFRATAGPWAGQCQDSGCVPGPVCATGCQTWSRTRQTPTPRAPGPRPARREPRAGGSSRRKMKLGQGEGGEGPCMATFCLSALTARKGWTSVTEKCRGLQGKPVLTQSCAQEMSVGPMSSAIAMNASSQRCLQEVLAPSTISVIAMNASSQSCTKEK